MYLSMIGRLIYQVVFFVQKAATFEKIDALFEKIDAPFGKLVSSPCANGQSGVIGLCR
jgi:hypothetical protein